MARCTLDDLIPSFKVRRVFLEPLMQNYTKYSVQIEGSVIDVIEDEDDGVADYLMTDMFKDNIQMHWIYSRDDSVGKLVNFLKEQERPAGQLSLPPWAQQYIVANLHDANWLANYGLNPSTTTLEEKAALFYDNLQTFHSEYPWGSFGVLTQKFRENFILHLTAVATSYANGLIDEGTIYFNNYTNELIENFGAIELDDDGNKVYDFMIPREDLTFENDASVEHCYFHAMLFFDFNNLSESLELGLPDVYESEYLAETTKWRMGGIYGCHILDNKISASSKVQDFRLSERIEEIIQPHRMTYYDLILDDVSNRSDKPDVNKSNITTKLFLSYKRSISFQNIHVPVYTNGIFYINFIQLLKRNTRHAYMYNNIMNMDPTFKQSFYQSVNIIKLDIYRVRIDSPQQKIKIADINSSNLQKLPGYRHDSCGFSFDDIAFRDLTFGEYTYEIDLEIVDPIYDIIEYHVENLRYGIKTYGNMIDYIHNNPQEYNELRDQLSTKAINDLGDIEKTTSNSGITYSDHVQSFFDLFQILTGAPLWAIELMLGLAVYLIEQYGTGTVKETEYKNQMMLELLNGQNHLERRKIENRHRIMQDVIFAAEKFFEVRAMNSSSPTTVQSSKELVKYSREWKVEASPRVVDGGMCNMMSLGASLNGFNMAMYEDRMSLEAAKHGGLDTVQTKNLGFMTPDGIDDISIYDSTTFSNIDTFLKLFSNIMETQVGNTNLENYRKMVAGTGNYSFKVQELKNDSGLFESFLHSLGATCTNKDMMSLNTYLGGFKKDKNFATGIDDARNKRAGALSPQQTRTLFNSEDEEEQLPMEERRQNVKDELAMQYIKKEHLIMIMLLSGKGYSILDRESYEQGNKQATRFDYDFDYPNERPIGKPYPKLFESNVAVEYFNMAENGKRNPLDMPLHRFILDNTFLVYYMSDIDINMKPVWTQLVNLESARNKMLAIGADRLICKLERYKDSNFFIGQGATSDREIISKYFYLTIA